MDSASSTTVVGIFIGFSNKLGPEGSQIVLIESTAGGTLIATSPDEGCSMKVILNHLDQAGLEWLLEALRSRLAA